MACECAVPQVGQRTHSARRAGTQEHQGMENTGEVGEEPEPQCRATPLSFPPQPRYLAPRISSPGRP